MADQPNRPVPGQDYGEGEAQRRAMRAVPLPDEAARFQQAMSAAGNVDLQGMVGLAEPSQRPDEPVTAGLPVGPGPGPEALPDQLRPDTGPDPDAVLMARHLLLLEQLALQPNSTQAVRNLVRRVRAQIPPDFDLSQVASPPDEES